MKIYNFHNQGKRPYQEDSYHIDSDRNLFIICDGVGGSQAGSTASQETISKIVSSFEQVDYVMDEQLLETIILDVQKHLSNLSENNQSLKGMGTTLILFYLYQGKGYVAHLGDSRLYYIPYNKEEYWVTKDHSFVQELFDEGLLKDEISMRNHPFKNRITKALTSSQILEQGDPSIKILDNFNAGDLLVMASDGALESYTSEEFVSFFRAKDKSLDLKWSIFQKVCFENSKDNNTSIGLLIN